MFFRSMASALASASTKSLLFDFKGLHELGCDQPHLVALLPQCPSEKVRS